MFIKNVSPGFHWWLSGKESNWQCRRLVFDPWSRKTPHAMEQLNLCATTREPVFRSPCFTTTEVITMRSRHTTTRELLLLSATRGKSMQQQRPSTVKKKKKSKSVALLETIFHTSWLSGPQVFEDVVLTVVFLHVRTRKEKDWGGSKRECVAEKLKS